MSPNFTRLAGLALLGAALSMPALADSLTSSASSAGSASSGSVSDSITGSSRSSSPNQVAEGNYRVIEVAEVAGRPAFVRLQLQAHEGDGPLWLTLPRQALAQQPVAAGDIVSARQRPYGIEFARGALDAPERQAFFLALADDWVGEIAARPIGL